MLNEDTYLNVGLDFIDAEGNRITSIQLVAKNRGTIADVLFENESVVKCVHLNEVDKTKFLDEATNLLNNSIPVTFHKTNLPKELEIGPL